MSVSLVVCMLLTTTLQWGCSRVELFRFRSCRGEEVWELGFELALKKGFAEPSGLQLLKGLLKLAPLVRPL